MILSVIKSLPQNDVNELTNNLSMVKTPTNSLGTYEMELIPIKDPFYPNESYNIFKDKDFELVENYLADEYLKNKFPCYAMKCSFVGNNMIAFHYQVNKFGNKKYLIVLSRIDENNEFNNEYLLIYYHPSYASDHFNKIRNNIKDNFISRLRFVKNCAPIVVNEYIEIGKVLKLGEGNDNESFPPIFMGNLKSEISDLKNQLNHKNKIIENLNTKIQILEKQLNTITNKYNEKESQIQNLKNNINKKDEELQQLKNKLNAYNIDKNDNKFGFPIKFQAINSEFDLPMICNENESISRLEEELYNQYPKYKDLDTYLICGGRVLKRFRTVKENNIKKYDTILVSIKE